MLLYTKSPYFQKLLEGLPSGMMIFNVDGNMYAVNEAAVRLLGRDRQDCLDMSAEELFSAFHGEGAFLEFAERFHVEEEDGPVDVVFTRADSRRFYLSMSKTILTEYGKAFGFMLSLVDNTRIREMHKREMLAASENARLHQEHAERLRQLSEGVAHQIRNPLMVISGFSGLLRRKTGDKDLAEYYEGIQENTDRLACIVESVAAYTSLARIAVADLNLLALVEDVVRQWREERGESAQEVDFQFEGLDQVVRADAGALAVAFKELFSNAQDFKKGNRVTISVEAEEKEQGILLIVSDDGVGIDETHRDYWFDPFFSTKSVGVGMGLCKVERVMREHGGRVAIERNQVGGTRVTLVFQKPAVPLESASC